MAHTQLLFCLCRAHNKTNMTGGQNPTLSNSNANASWRSPTFRCCCSSKVCCCSVVLVRTLRHCSVPSVKPLYQLMASQHVLRPMACGLVDSGRLAVQVFKGEIQGLPGWELRLTTKKDDKGFNTYWSMHACTHARLCARKCAHAHVCTHACVTSYNHASMQACAGRKREPREKRTGSIARRRS